MCYSNDKNTHVHTWARACYNSLWNKSKWPIFCHNYSQAAQHTPEQIAIVNGTPQQSYRTLDELSNQFAHLLQQAGVVRGDRVGLLWLTTQ